MRRTPCVRPWVTAAAESARAVLSSETRLYWASRTTSLAVLMAGMRSRSTSASIPAARNRSMLSRRESANIEQPPANMARAISGSPQTHFVTPATEIPWLEQSSTTASAFRLIRVQSATILKPCLQLSCPPPGLPVVKIADCAVAHRTTIHSRSRPRRSERGRDLRALCGPILRSSTAVYRSHGGWSSAPVAGPDHRLRRVRCARRGGR